MAVHIVCAIPFGMHRHEACIFHLVDLYSVFSLLVLYTFICSLHIYPWGYTHFWAWNREQTYTWVQWKLMFVYQFRICILSITLTSSPSLSISVSLFGFYFCVQFTWIHWHELKSIWYLTFCIYIFQILTDKNCACFFFSLSFCYTSQNYDAKWPIFEAVIADITITITIIVDHIINHHARTVIDQWRPQQQRQWQRLQQQTTQQTMYMRRRRRRRPAVRTAKVIAALAQVAVVAVAVVRIPTVQVIQIHQIEVKAHIWAESVIMPMNAHNCWLKMNAVAAQWLTMTRWTIHHPTKSLAHKSFHALNKWKKKHKK